MLDWLWLFALGVHGHYDIVSIETTFPDRRLRRTEYVVQAGESPLNRFSITHVSTRDARSKRVPVLLLSPFLLPGAFYEIAETLDYGDSLAGRLASTRHDVWLVDQRRTGLPPGDCESQVVDCEVMVDWDFETFSSDALFAAALARALSPHPKLVVGGFSAGSNAALATINRAPAWFSGLFLYEGTFYTEDPVIMEHNVAACALLEDALETGAVFDPSVAIFNPVINLAAADPNGLSPLGVFPPGTTNQRALLFVFGTPPPPGALSPTPNFVRHIVDFDSEQFVYANQDRLELLGPMFDNYASLAALRDLACGLSGVDDTHVDNLAEFSGDALMFLGGTGFGQAMFDTAEQLSGADSVTIEHRPEFGEGDAYFHQNWVREFYHPLRRWLRRHPR